MKVTPNDIATINGDSQRHGSIAVRTNDQSVSVRKGINVQTYEVAYGVPFDEAETKADSEAK